MLTGEKPTTMKRGLFEGRPALRVLIFYAAGIAAGFSIPVMPIIIFFILLALAVTALVFHIRRLSLAATILLYASLFVAGTLQYKVATSGFPPTHVANIAAAGDRVVIKGEIAEEPDIRTDRTYLVVEVDSLTWKKRDLKSSGRIMVKIKEPSSALSLRDKISFSGNLFAPGGARIPGGFDYSKYLANREIFGMVVLNRADEIERYHQQSNSWRNFIDDIFVNYLVAPVRNILLEGYQKYLPSTQAYLLGGFVLGEKRNIPDKIARLFRDTGTFHLMAVSGSNVAVVTAFLLALFYPVNRKIRLILVLAGIIFFSFLTRNEPSVVRASVMAAIGIIGFYRQKNADSIGLLGFAGLVLLVWKPLWLFNIGFQLSMAACAGIIYFVPKLTGKPGINRTFLRRIGRWLLIIIITTLSAQIAVMPFMAQYFNRISVSGILANVPMIPLAAMLTVAGLAFLPFILAGDLIASLAAMPIKLLMSIIFPVLEFFAGLPLAVVNLGSPGIFKILLFFAGLYLFSELVFSKRLSLKCLMLSLIALNGIIWTTYLKGPGIESLTFIDCGQDRAVLYCTPEGKNYLWYDCQGSEESNGIEFSLLPFLLKQGVVQIDTLFTDNKMKILPLVSEIKVIDVWQPDEPEDSLVDEVIDISQYISPESTLNNRVKFVRYKSDNNIKPSGGGCYYKIETSGGTCILAGGLSPVYVAGLKQSAFLIELPWSVQPYGAILKNLTEYPPALLVFSPGRRGVQLVKGRNLLTYMISRTRAASLHGTFRIRFSDNVIYEDYMIDQ